MHDPDRNRTQRLPGRQTSASSVGTRRYRATRSDHRVGHLIRSQPSTRPGLDLEERLLTVRKFDEPSLSE